MNQDYTQDAEIIAAVNSYTRGNAAEITYRLCDILLRNHKIYPSYSAIRSVFKSGSTKVISDAIKSYIDETPSLLGGEVKIADLPSDICALYAEIWRKSCSAAATSFDEERNGLLAEVRARDETIAGLLSQLDEAHREKIANRAALDNAETKNANLNNEIRRTEASLRESSLNAESLSRRIADLESSLASEQLTHARQVAQIEESSAASIQKITKEYDGLRSHLLQQTEIERQQIRQSFESRMASLASKLAEREDDLASQLSLTRDLEAELSTCRSEIQRAEHERNALQTTIRLLESRIEEQKALLLREQNIAAALTAQAERAAAVRVIQRIGLDRETTDDILAQVDMYYSKATESNERS